MIEEPFATGNSFLHRTDPRTRLLVATVYSVVVAVCTHLLPLTVAVGASLVMVLLARLNPVLLVKRLILVNGFILLFWLVLPWTYGGEVLFRWGILKIYHQGLMLAGVLTIKCNAILMALIAMVSTMSLVTLGQAMNRLQIPSVFVNLFLLVYRYVFVIEKEYARIIRAIKIRGFSPRTSLHTYKTYAYVVGMLFVRASERAERVYGAMLCRGFKGRFYSLAEFRYTTQSWVFGGVMLMLTAAIAWLEAVGYGG